MIDNQLVKDIMQLSNMERVQVMELLFQSLKSDLEKENESVVVQSPAKPFKVRKFDLGQELHVDRENVYAERM